MGRSRAGPSCQPRFSNSQAAAGRVPCVDAVGAVGRKSVGFSLTPATAFTVTSLQCGVSPACAGVLALHLLAGCVLSPGAPPADWGGGSAAPLAGCSSGWRGMTVPAPGRTPAHPLVQLLGSLPHACLSWLQPLGVFLSPSSLQMPASASPGYICPSEASSLRYWIPWDGDSFQKLPVRVPAGRKWNHFPCLGSHPRRLHRHSRQASATMHQGLHYGSGMKTCPGAPACGAGGCAWPRPRSVSSPHRIRRPRGRQAPLHTLSCLLVPLRLQKEKQKQAFPGPETSRRTSSLRQDGSLEAQSSDVLSTFGAGLGTGRRAVTTHSVSRRLCQERRLHSPTFMFSLAGTLL